MEQINYCDQAMRNKPANFRSVPDFSSYLSTAFERIPLETLRKAKNPTAFMTIMIPKGIKKTPWTAGFFIALRYYKGIMPRTGDPKERILIVFVFIPDRQKNKRYIKTNREKPTIERQVVL
jgi:hypothetical protein